MRIALNLKGLAVERRFVHLVPRRAARARLPGDESAGSCRRCGRRQALTQSLAIIEYLEEKHRRRDCPSTPEDRAWVRAFALTIACDIHPIDNLRVLQYSPRSWRSTSPAATAGTCTGSAKASPLLEAQLAERGSLPIAWATTHPRRHLPGAQVANSQRLNLDLSPTPRIRSINESLLKLEPFAAAQPSRQPDAE